MVRITSAYANTAAESVAKSDKMILSPETVVHISMLSDQANVVHDAAAKKCLLPGSVRQRLPPQILQPCHAGN